MNTDCNQDKNNAFRKILVQIINQLESALTYTWDNGGLDDVLGTVMYRV